MRSWERWLFPFPVGIAMAIGSVMGMSMASDALLQGGPAGDVAGAQGAILAMLCLVAGFVLSMLTVVTAAMMHRRAPAYAVLRIGLALAAGILTGALAGTPAVRSLMWLVLLAAPAAVSWTFHGRGLREPPR